MKGIRCYAIAVSGTVSYKYGFQVNTDDYDGCDVFYTVVDPKGNTYELTSKAEEPAYMVEERILTFPIPYDYDNEPSWNVKAEIKDETGAVVYTETFNCEEYLEYNCIILQIVS